MNDRESLDEAPTRTVDETLDWICWKWAEAGEDAYRRMRKAKEGTPTAATHYDLLGNRHATAFEILDYLEMFGYDVRGRVDRELERRRQRGVGTRDISWEWYET